MRRWVFGLLLIPLTGSVMAREPESAKERAKAASAQEAQVTKESYLKKANQEVQEWSSKIQSLEDRSRLSGSRVRQELDEHLKAIRHHYQEIRRGVQEITGAGDGAWGNLRRGIEESTQQLSRDYEKAVTSVKKTEKRISDKSGDK